MRAYSLFVILLLLFLVGIAPATHAEEQLMNLWPNQRAAHNAEMEADAAQYQVRRQEYTDHLYTTGGEKPMDELDGLHDIMSDYPSIEPIPVDVGEVADIIKSSDNQTANSEQ